MPVFIAASCLLVSLTVMPCVGFCEDADLAGALKNPLSETAKVYTVSDEGDICEHLAVKVAFRLPEQFLIAAPQYEWSRHGERGEGPMWTTFDPKSGTLSLRILNTESFTHKDYVVPVGDIVKTFSETVERYSLYYSSGTGNAVYLVPASGRKIYSLGNLHFVGGGFPVSVTLLANGGRVCALAGDSLGVEGKATLYLIETASGKLLDSAELTDVIPPIDNTMSDLIWVNDSIVLDILRIRSPLIGVFQIRPPVSLSQERFQQRFGLPLEYFFPGDAIVDHGNVRILYRLPEGDIHLSNLGNFARGL